MKTIHLIDLQTKTNNNTILSLLKRLLPLCKDRPFGKGRGSFGKVGSFTKGSTLSQRPVLVQPFWPEPGPFVFLSQKNREKFLVCSEEQCLHTWL